MRSKLNECEHTGKKIKKNFKKLGKQYYCTHADIKTTGKKIYLYIKTRRDMKTH